MTIKLIYRDFYFAVIMLSRRTNRNNIYRVRKNQCTKKIFFLNKIKKNKKKKKKIGFRVLLTRLSTRTDGLCCLCQHWRENRCCCRTAGSSFCRVRPFSFFSFFLFVCCRRHRSIVEIFQKKSSGPTHNSRRQNKKEKSKSDLFFLADYNLLFLRSKKRRF